MKRLSAVSIFLATAVGWPLQATGQHANDWVLLRVHADAGPTAGAVQLTGPVRLNPAFPEIYGRFQNGETFSCNCGGGDLRASSTSEAGGFMIQVPTGQERVWIHNLTLTFDLAAGEEAALVMFQPESDVSGLRVRRFIDTGAPTVQVVFGSGTRGILLADPENDGIAISAGSAAVGTAARHETVPTGIVGTMLWECESCGGSWESPDGRTEDWQASGRAGDRYTLVGEAAFAGDAGLWTWSWEGAMTAQGSWVPLAGPSPVLVAWAPIGDYWRLFD